jgi:hypothetical protein
MCKLKDWMNEDQISRKNYSEYVKEIVRENRFIV